jgi:hypothetical protein
MDEDARRYLHKLITRTLDRDKLAEAALEEMIFGLDRAGSSEDVEQALQMVAIIGGDELRARVVARLQENDQAQRRLQYPIVHP